MRYWGVAFDTDWQAGSTMTMELDKDAVKIADPAQVVLESEPAGGSPTPGIPSRRSGRPPTGSATRIARGSPASGAPR